MKLFFSILLVFASVLSIKAASVADNIHIEAFIVTKAELRRHMAADLNDQFRPSTYQDLRASANSDQPDYLVVRFRQLVLGHYSGEAEAQVTDGPRGIKFNVMLHFNKGWVEYFIPLDGFVYGRLGQEGGPGVSVKWNSLHAK